MTAIPETEVDVTVLREYTDGHLRKRIAEHPASSPWRRSHEALLRIPEGWRQSVWAAAYAKAYRTESRSSRHDWTFLESVEVPTGIDLDDAIIGEVNAFLSGRRPPRMETLNRPRKEN